MQENLIKKILTEYLDFLKYKINNDLLTMQEVNSFAETIESNLTVLGTADDFAKFYDQPKTNVTSVINRRVFEKPIRRVFYSFKAFRKVVPDRWRKGIHR